MASATVRFYAIVPTMFTLGGRPDVAAMSENVSRLAGHGISGVLLTGSYGEFQTLTQVERVDITRAVVESGTVDQVMSGAAALNSEDAVAVGQALTDAGADQVMVSAPFAAELTDADLERHFAVIGEKLVSALVVYNNPVFGVDLAPALLERITLDPAYVSIKQGTKSLASMVDLIGRVEVTGQAQVLAAADLACAAAIGAGAGGVTSTNVWIFPDVFIQLADPAVPPARKAALTSALRPYADVVRQLGQPRTVKAAMVARGYAGSSAVRHPYVPLSSQEEALVKDALDRTDEQVANA